MLQPFFQFGVVTDSVPFESLVSEQKQRSGVVTSCENCLVSRSSSNLAIWAKSDLLPGQIRAHACNFVWSFVSCGDCVIHALHKQRKLDPDMTMGCKDHAGDDFVRCLLLLGRAILLAGHESGNLCVWEVTEQRLLSSTGLGAPIKLLVHPAAYVNKALIALADPSGADRIVLWNVKLCTAVAQYEMPCRLNCIVQSPAIDVCAVGLVDGSVCLLNLKSEQVLFGLRAGQDNRAVTAIAFHVDKPYLLAGRQDGTIDVFDLEKRRLILSNTEKNLGGVTKLEAVAGRTELFLASYEGNALKQWMVDGDTFRECRRQLGNLEPVNKCHFLPGCDSLVAVCGNSVVVWDSAISAFTYAKNRNYYETPVFDVVCADRRASTFLMPEWADMVVVHKQCRRVSLARMDGKREFRRGTAKNTESAKLLSWFQPSLDGEDPIPLTSYVLCCAISHCGNFAALGYSSSHIVVFNLQSREERARLSVAEPASALAFDLLNRFLLLGGEQGLVGLKLFRLKAEVSLAEDVRLKAGITGQFSAHRNGNLFAVPLADCSVSIVRVTVNQIEQVRNVACDGPVTCTKFSDDGRFLACSSLDSTLRLFDVASGSELDCLRFEQPVVCFDFRDDLLACACRGSLQLSVFACSFYYDRIKLFVKKDHRALLTACLEQPACSAWRSLDKADEILKNNKPEPALAKPKNAPFFLPAVPTLTGFKLVTDAPHSTEINTALKSTFVDSTELTKQLQRADLAVEEVFDLLKRMNVIQLEFEIGNLLRMAADPEKCQLFERFVSLLKTVLGKRTDFDFVCALASRTAVKLCSELSDTGTLQQYTTLVGDLLHTVESIWRPIQQNYERSLCLIEFLKNDCI